MKFSRTELGIKIGSLADEARRIRNREQTLLLGSQKRRVISLLRHKGQWNEETHVASPELQEALKARLNPALQRFKGEELWKAGMLVDRVGRKVVRKFARQGMTKEEILAIPGVAQSLRNYPIYESIHRHRKGPLRHEARHAQLALAFLRERDYSKTEDKAESYPAWEKIADIAKRFSQEDSRILMQKFEQWRQEAVSFIRGRELMNKATYPTEPYKMLT